MASCGPAFFGNTLALTADPFWSDVVLMLDCAGADGSTTFIDLSPAGNIVTAVGGAQVDTAIVPPFGGQSALFDGVDDLLRVTSSASLTFGTGPFTIEMWLRKIGASANFFTFSGQNWNVYYTFVTQTMAFWDGGIDRIARPGVAYPGFVGWYHLALVRDAAGNVYLWDNGVQVGSTWVDAGPTNLTASDILIGHYPGSGVFAAMNAAPIRITRQPRYTAPFTPPPGPFPLF